MQFSAYSSSILYLIMTIGLDSGKHLDENVQ